MNKAERLVRRRDREIERQRVQQADERFKAALAETAKLHACIKAETARVFGMLDDTCWERHAYMKKVSPLRRRACIKLGTVGVLDVWLGANGKLYIRVMVRYYSEQFEGYQYLDFFLASHIAASECHRSLIPIHRYIDVYGPTGLKDLCDLLTAIQSVDDINR